MINRSGNLRLFVLNQFKLTIYYIMDNRTSEIPFPSEHPLVDVVMSIRQVAISLWLLASACARALFALAKFLIVWARLISPYTNRGIHYLMNWVSSVSLFIFSHLSHMSASGKIAVSTTSAALISFIFMWRRGVFHRWIKSGRRTLRHTHRHLRRYLAQLKFHTYRIWNATVEVGTIIIPSLTVVLPLRVYLNRHVFRRLFTMSTFVIPLWFSIKALIDFYGSRPVKPKTPQKSQGHIARRRSLLDNSKPDRVAPKRKTVGGGLFGGGSLFSGDDDLSNERTPGLSVICDDEVMGLTVWLDYWVVASVFDLLMKIPILLVRILFRSHSPPIYFVQFGHIEETTPDPPYTPAFLTPNLNPNSSWKSIAANSYSSLLSLYYDLTYSILLLFVISHKHRYLIFARRSLVGILDTFIFTLTGLKLIPASVNGFSPLDPTSRGLLPSLWTFVKLYLPPTILLGFDMLAHVPQILLLMLPSFLLRTAVFLVSVLYPLVGSLRSLENSVLIKQGYWLTYFTLLSVYETLLMRWLRSTPIWSWLPLHSHLELFFITLIQLLCLSPQWITEALLHRVLSLNSVSRIDTGLTDMPNAATSQRSMSPVIKMEIEDDDDTPSNRQTSKPICTTSAFSDPVVHRRRKIDSATSSNPASSGTRELGHGDISRQNSPHQSKSPRQPLTRQSSRKSFVPEAVLQQTQTTSSIDTPTDSQTERDDDRVTRRYRLKTSSSAKNRLSSRKVREK